MVLPGPGIWSGVSPCAYQGVMPGISIPGNPTPSLFRVLRGKEGQGGKKPASREAKIRVYTAVIPPVYEIPG
ncbi:hypothetical protein ASZ90_015093 [hydrocarbon metagenome]|uniref:Uncharacterized protein n=1 Tax=hydrocarbon metagenome TaxID=938273 RepID=A0A0W8F312_9ZZZZ